VTALAVFAVLAAIFLRAVWWGSDVVFDPPKMLPNEVWPEEFGLAHEPVGFLSADGLRLKGWLIPAAETTDRTVVVCHGWGDNKGDVLSHVHALARKFNLFLFDSRHHGESDGHRSTIGCLESRDVTAALAFLRERRLEWTRRMGIFGISMGSAVAIWAAARDEGLRCVAVESPFPSFEGVVARWSWNAFRLPFFPFPWATVALMRWRLGEDPEPYSPRYRVAAIAPRPMLFIAGELDELMPVAEVREVFEAAGHPKELWIVPKAAHGKCEETAPEAYRQRLSAFFERNLT